MVYASLVTWKIVKRVDKGWLAQIEGVKGFSETDVRKHSDTKLAWWLFYSSHTLIQPSAAAIFVNNTTCLFPADSEMKRIKILLFVLTQIIGLINQSLTIREWRQQQQLEGS